MKCLAVVCIVLLLAIPAIPQSRPRTVEAQRPPIRLAVDLVLVDAQVMQDKSKRLVGGLTKEDFTLTEDGTKQEITHFSQDTLPLSVLLLVDRAGCLDPFGGEVREATRQALGRLKPEDEVALMAFAQTTDLVQPFSRDRSRIVDGLVNMPAHHDDAEHCFNIALYDAARYMVDAANPGGRRVIVVLTGHTRGFDCRGPSSKDALAEVIESGSVVCGLIPKSAGQRAENGAIGGIAGTARIFGVPTFSLRHFTDETGGDIFEAKASELAAAFDDLVNHLRTRYSIGFVSSNTRRDGSYRKLKLEIAPAVAKREGKLVVRARRGYYAPKSVVSDPRLP